MVSAATEYRKNGFNDKDAAQLAQVSSIFQNVADESISTGDAAQFLISQLIAFNKTTGDVEGNAMHIADALNEVANNFAVGTGDLATGLKVVASSSAGMNNSFEQTIGLMTAITEQTKNASKASRGLNAIMANLAQVLDDASSNGKKITTIFEQLGVEMYENGQLKSGYDLLAGLAEKWDTLDNNSQKYIATTIAGTTQLNNFLALMNNFGHAVDATNKALDSQGSAMRENSAYMESIQAKLSQVQSTFQDFANNVISSDLAKAVLDLANGLLQIANTDLGQIVTQIVLLTSLGWGATSLTKALGIFKVGIEQFKNLAGVITGVGAAGSITLPIILGIASVLVVGGALWKATEDSRKSFEELETKISDTNGKLKTNKERLKEISDLPWNERTQEILDEKEALEKENDELQAQIDKLETLSEKKAKQSLKGGYVTGERIQVSGITGEYAGRFDSGLQGQSFETYEELVKYLDNYIPNASKKTRQELEALGVQFETVQGEVYKTGEAYEQELIKQANELTEKLKTNHSLTDEDLKLYDEVTSKLGTLAQAHQLVGDESTSARDALDSLATAYEDAAQHTEKFGNSIELNAAQVDAIKSKYPELAANITQVGDSYYLAQNEAINSVSGFISANGRIYLDAKDKAQKTLQQLQLVAKGYQATARLILTEYSINPTQANREKLNQAASISIAAQTALRDLGRALNVSSVEGYDVRDVGIVSGSSGSGGAKSSSSGSKSVTDLALKNFQSLQKDLDHLLAMGKITQEDYYNQLEKLVEQYKTNATAHMKEYGLNVNQINQNMYSYEEKIYSGRAKLAEELASKQEEEAKKAAEAQKSNYEIAASYVVQKIREEIDELETQKSEIEKFYEDQIQALQDTNDELERQIQYEQLLNNLAQAKDKGLYVFSNGQFQYMQDVEAISAAQAELDAYERDEALRKEIENLNKLKDQATASIDAQIEQWNQYKDEWSGVVDQYTEEQNRLIAEQVLGIDLEQKNWEQRLMNAQTFADKYNSIMASLNGSKSTKKTDTSAAPQSGKGYYFDFSKTTGGSGWTEAEMREGFHSSSSTAKTTAIKALKGKKYAGGTLNAVGGLSLVGEQGPELRVLDQGDGVIPADVTRNLWGWGKINPNAITSNMSNIFNIDNLTLPNARDAQTLITGLKQMAYQRAYKRA
jgi:TP901 family phage tail tape measure protein